MSSETTIAIYGPGLLGGSLALAIQERMPATALRLWARRDSAEESIRDRGIQAEFFTDATAAACGVSLIILCTPVETMPALAAQIAQADLSADCLITDVGSVKGSVVRALEPILGSRFIGSHPMAGSEKAGIETARACLFQNATCLVTPGSRLRKQVEDPGSRLRKQVEDPGSCLRKQVEDPGSCLRKQVEDPAPLPRLRTFWQTLGCNVLEMSPEEHDEKVARISHLPHMMAAVTTLAALRTDPSAVACVANGFRDTTRVAGGDPGLWTGIALENRPALLAQLQAAATTLTELLEILGKPDEEELRRFLAEAQSLRRTVPAAVS